MRTMHRAPFLLVLLLAPVHAQDPPVRAQDGPTTTPALHHGWLLEVLDGNFGAAADLYEQTGQDETVPPELRALALARRVELERLRGGQELDVLIEQLQGLLGEIGVATNRLRFQTAGLLVPSDGLAEAARAGGEALRAWLEDRRGRRYPTDTRPLVPDLYTLFLEDLARSRQATDDIAQQRLWRELSRGRRFPRPRPRAVEYLDLVLDGKTDEARRGPGRSLRRSQIASVPVPRDPAPALQTARRRLERQLARVDLNPEERRVLRRLQVRLGELVDEGRSRDAYELLRNLPVFGDQLLGGTRR